MKKFIANRENPRLTPGDESIPEHTGETPPLRRRGQFGMKLEDTPPLAGSFIKSKQGQQLGFRTPDFIKGKMVAGPKPPQPPKSNPSAFRIQHKG